MPYTVDILRTAQKDLSRISRADVPEIVAAIRVLADDPRSRGCTRLAGRDAWRIRVGAYRVIYEISDQRLTVLVIAVGHRGDVYKR
ncbi:MAG: type II toxin-antitoxin system RelE/ParE family toxin [Armatimonadetes bacterium]|nr:type II toxin-antitoxin system RelE/ParE family toxin [Armatimonadota bacterium]